jgi:hypothetical protein
MAYIKDSNIELTCFLTQKGKILYLNGSEQDITITHFVVGDSDTNYQLTSNGNILTRNFIPALSGEYNECNSSLSSGLNINYIINKDPKGVLISSYCTSDNTLIQKYQNPDGTVQTIETLNSTKCGFIYYSNPVSKTFIPNITPTLPFDDGSSPDLQYQRTSIDDYTVSLPYGYKTNIVSQLEADNLALNYLNTNGQSIADINGTITFYSSGRVKQNIIKTSPILQFPFTYPKVTLNYLSEIFNSKTFNDNNNKINKYLNDTYQNIVNNLNLTPIGAATLSGIDFYSNSIKTSILNKKNTFYPITPKIIDGTVMGYYFSLIIASKRIGGVFYGDIIKNIHIINSADYYGTQLTDTEIETLNTTFINGDKDFTTKGIVINKTQLYNNSATEITFGSTKLTSQFVFNDFYKNNVYHILPDNNYDMIVIEYENLISINANPTTLTIETQSAEPESNVPNLEYNVIDSNQTTILK